MSTELLSQRAPLEPAWQRAIVGPVLVATDGGPESVAAMRVADALARRDGRHVHILSVLEPMPAFFPAGEGLLSIPADSFEEERRRAQLERIGTLVRQTLDADAAWDVEVLTGPVAQTIARVARERGAALLALGLRRHGPVDRIFRGETLQQVIRLSTVPVLAVPPGAEGLPRKAMVAVDFSRSSFRAARAASTVVAAGGELALAHVKPPTRRRGEEAESWTAIYDQGVHSAFQRVRRDLGPRHDLLVRPVELEGDTADELVGFARRSDVDLLAVGSHGHDFIERLLLGSVTTRLLRRATCSVLVTPPMARLGVEGSRLA
ncbi:MAG TPA: universal stress protein [Gemmatimonadaceae bacterium]